VLTVDDGSAETATINAKTWSEEFPISKTITVASQNSQLDVTQSGTADGYVLIDGTGATINVDDKYDYCIHVTGDYVILRGFTLKEASIHGIYLDDAHDVIIENCNISGWGRKQGDYAYEQDGGIRSDGGHVERIVVQRCAIFNPRYDSNDWSEPNSYNSNGGNHPRGAQAVTFNYSAGNHVIRYNDLYTDNGNFFNDVIGSNGNSSNSGFPAFDSDIYGNYVSGGNDDAIESEGANRNVRIWGNYIDKSFIAIGNASVTIGPLYVWKNTFGTAGDLYSACMKMGYSGDIKYMKGYMYIFNNTLVNDNGFLGLGKDSRKIRHCITRNNILEPRKSNSISTNDKNLDNDFDYDLCSGIYPADSENHGIDGSPTYVSGAGFNRGDLSANYALTKGSKGFDAGIIIPNFIENYTGEAPDMGAFEADGNVTVYGTKANLPQSSYTLTVHTKGYGSVSNSGGDYASGTDVEITATPLETYEFKKWTGDYFDKSNPVIITLISDMTLTAVFDSPDSISYYEGCDADIVNGACESKNNGYYGGGYVNSDDVSGASVEWTNVNTPRDGSYYCTVRYANGIGSALPGDIYVNGEKVDVLNGSVTSDWSDWVIETFSLNLKSGDNNVKIIATTEGGLPNIDRLTVSAEPFSMKEFKLTIGVDGNGTVSVDPEKDIYNAGDEVTLTANAELGSLFDSWTGDVSGSANPLTVLMDGDITVTANFIIDPDMIVLDGAKSTISNGRVSTKHEGYHGDGYADTKNNLGEYIEWTFDVAESGTYKCILRYALGGSSLPYRLGDVTVNGNYINSYSSYFTGDFGIWGTESQLLNLVEGENVLRITSTTDRGLPNVDILQIDLTSKDKPFNVLTTDFTGEGYMTFFPAGAVYELGQQVTVKANPYTGYVFDSWSGDLTGNNDSVKFAMNGDMSITADFVVATGIEDNFNSDCFISVRPNPFASSTRFTFNIPEPGNVKIVIYDLTGSELAVLTDKYYTPGEYSLVWNIKVLIGRALSPGMYLAKIRAGDVVKVIKLLHVR
jgi:hypothetical protein